MPRGQPQIEITYDVDSDGILNVTALEKSSGKMKNITIKNESGKLSKEEINRMVKEAEQYKAQDDALGEKIGAKNRLESFIYSMKARVKDANPDDETFKTTLEETEKWLDENGSTATKEELEEKLKALQSGAPPTSAQADASKGGTHDGPSGMQSGAPTVEDID